MLLLIKYLGFDYAGCVKIMNIIYYMKIREDALKTALSITMEIKKPKCVVNAIKFINHNLFIQLLELFDLQW